MLALGAVVRRVMEAQPGDVTVIELALRPVPLTVMIAGWSMVVVATDVDVTVAGAAGGGGGGGGGGGVLPPPPPPPHAASMNSVLSVRPTALAERAGPRVGGGRSKA